MCNCQGNIPVQAPPQTVNGLNSTFSDFNNVMQTVITGILLVGVGYIFYRLVKK